MKRHLSGLLIVLFVSGGIAAGYAQPVDIPDPNLRAAISEELDGAPVTRETMLQLTELDALRERRHRPHRVGICATIYYG